MSQFFEIHPDNPQARLIHRGVEIVREGGVIVYPTDSSYALGCHIGDKRAMERLAKIRNVSNRHNFTLMCRDLSEISNYSLVDNSAYRLMKSLTPGPYTFILKANREVPRRLQNPKKKTIGLRVPENSIAHALLEELNEPMMSSTLILPDQKLPMTDAFEIREQLEHFVDLVIDGGNCGIEPTTVVDLSDGNVMVTRQGKGEYDFNN
ncbi:MAG: threonylcarbamoyl-AMP synthase [Sulfuriflexus sp.]|nr:threonylcarbamoyl-AMP synthase [Sulfuriflexus sp.]